MNFANHRFTWLTALVFALLAGYFTYTNFSSSDGIFDYQESRDKVAVKKMFHDNYKMLYFGDLDKISVDDFNVDFLLDNRSSSQFLAMHDTILKVLRVSGKTVGFLGYHAKSAHCWHMHFLIVDQDYRGKGYASKLVQYFIDDAIARGALKLTTFTRLANTKARALYEGKFKFKGIHYPVGHHYEHYLDLVLYPQRK